ncbi:alternate-type signal peptide domain-containing protein [Microbacterium esteraromaticum]|uniref:alternate-type signal peptide domain-containing protein n=1 Tax=Microbacterium esteraromaticum TaxID=57043 RepID=UPI0030A371F1
MNKTTKGTIAASAAVLLLLGTGGSLAYWNTTADLGGQTISAGQLKVEPAGSPVWTIKHNSGDATPVGSIQTVKIVPGDTLAYTGEFNITAEGQNLAYTATLVNGSIKAGSTAEADIKLAELLKESAVVVVKDANGAPVAGPTFTTTGSSVAKKVTVTVTIKWPSTTPAVDNPAKLGVVSLSGFGVELKQVDASTPTP